jgi:hypothetical protein
MKYITTEKHPELKEGIELHYWELDSTWRAKPSNFYQCKQNQLDGLLADGYVKEVEYTLYTSFEEKFTKSDMIEFANYLDDNFDSSDTKDRFNNYFYWWLKQRK